MLDSYMLLTEASFLSWFRPLDIVLVFIEFIFKSNPSADDISEILKYKIIRNLITLTRHLHVADYLIISIF